MYILTVSYGLPSKKYPTNGIFQFEQATELEKLGNKVIFVSVDMRAIIRTRRPFLEKKIVNNILCYNYNFYYGPFNSNIKHIIEKTIFIKVLKRIIKENGKPDIAHIHFGDTAIFAYETLIKNSIPYVITEHSSTIGAITKESKEFDSFKEAYDNAKGIIAVSSFVGNVLKTKFKVDSYVIGNMINPDQFKLSNINTENKHEYFSFVSAAHLVERKGFRELVEAFQKLEKENPNVRLLIMGDGADMPYIENKIKNNTNVHLYGKYNKDEFNDELNKAQCFVLASKFETFGVVYVEAMMGGFQL